MWFQRVRGDQKQRDFAEAVGLDPATISRLETGDQIPKTSHVDAVLSALGKDVPTFLTELAEICSGGVAHPGRKARKRIKPDELQMLHSKISNVERELAAVKEQLDERSLPGEKKREGERPHPSHR